MSFWFGLVAAFWLIFHHHVLYATPLTGSTGATEASPWGAAMNPANATALPSSEIQVVPNLYQWSELLVRYPGHPAITRSDGGLGEPTTFMPRAVLRLGAWSIALTEVIPPASIEMPLAGVPLVLFGQPQLVDLDVTAESKGGFAGSVACQWNENFSLGLGVSYRSLAIAAAASSSSDSSQLAVLNLTDRATLVLAGLRFKVLQGKLTIGLSTNLYHQNIRGTNLSSTFLDGVELATRAAGEKNLGSPFDRILAGVGFRLAQIALVTAEVEYRRITPTTEFSLVDFAEKPKDSYNAGSFRAGIEFGTTTGYQFLGGAAYQAASIGPGSRNAAQGGSGRSGFGFTELTSVMGGLDPLRPFWNVSLGARGHFGELLGKSEGSTLERAGKRKIQRRRPTSEQRSITNVSVRRWSVAAGLMYQSASLGIDQDGEQPGAYQQTKIAIPVELSWRF